jgi:glutamate-1-semialdehyde aminotransferase
MKFINSKKIYKKTSKYLAGPSTFSKGLDLFLNNISPYAIKKSLGCYTYDVDGNKFIDNIMSLGAVILGHSNKKINSEVIKQLKKGTIYSLASVLEGELAEMLCERIPSAEVVRLGKNGNDATTAAIRLARHFTGNDHILFCGYHAWQDWYISKTSMNSGIPKEIGSYSHRFNYNDLDSLIKLFEEFHGKIACVIMEPISKEEPVCKNICSLCETKNEKSCKGFLYQVQKLTKKNNCLLIFDEVVTGFRVDRGGYQNICGITPDLSCFSKAMGNGFPISALVGKKEIMSKSQEIFYSLTFGGENLSIAASIETLKYIDKHQVCKKINIRGNKIISHLKKKIKTLGLENYIFINGYPGKTIFNFVNYENSIAENMRIFWISNLIQDGVLNNGYQILSYAHDDAVVTRIISYYDRVLEDIKHKLGKDIFIKKNKINLNQDLRK